MADRVRKSRRERGSLKPTLNQLSDAVNEVLQEIITDTYEAIDRGLDKAARYTEQKLMAATPKGETGATEVSWEVDFRYKNVRYIYNTNTRPGNPLNDEGSNVPIVNMLEFGSKGKPFVRRTLEMEQNNIINIIKKEIENGST